MVILYKIMKCLSRVGHEVVDFRFQYINLGLLKKSEAFIVLLTNNFLSHVLDVLQQR